MHRYPLQNDWYFTPQFDASLPVLEAPTDALTPVRLPHTVKELPFNGFSEKLYQMVSGYVRFLKVPEDWQGLRVAVTFDGAAHFARVYCNGTPLAEHRCGYTAFTVDLTDHLRPGQVNNLTVELDSRESLNQPPFGNVIDYLTYGGLYREAWLEVGAPARVEDVCVRADQDGSLTCLPTCREADGCTLELTVTDDAGTVCARWQGDAAAELVSMSVPQARLWSLETPTLYTLTAVLKAGDETVDTRRVRFGFRRVEFRPEGFYLNGQRVQLRGLNRHQCWPYLGYAAPRRAQRLDADILKYELGLNTVRTSHYPQSQHFLDRCDEIGLLVLTEIPGWQHIGDADWKDQAVRNTEEMVLQYRNHPSIFLWGVRINESLDDDELYTRTNRAAHALDPTRPTGGIRYLKESHLLEDVYTFNDFSYHGNNPGCLPRDQVTARRDAGYLITEFNGHMFPTKPCDCESHRLAHALRHARVVSDAAQQPGISGTIGWCMFDYNTHQEFGSGDRICYHGVMDMFRNPKLAAALYQSQQEEEPVLEVSSSMDLGEYPGGTLKTVGVFTNGDWVDLYRNDLFIGSYFPAEKYRGLPHPPVLIRETVGSVLEREEGLSPKAAQAVKELFQIMAQNGGALTPAARAKATRLAAFHGISREKLQTLFGRYVSSWGGTGVTWRFDAVKDGQVIASVQRISSQTLHLEVRADTLSLTEGDGWDMATVRIRALNEFGCLSAYLNRCIHFQAEGTVALVGPASVPLSGGMAGTYVRTTGRAGEGRLTVTMDGAEPVVLTFQVRPV